MFSREWAHVERFDELDQVLRAFGHEHPSIRILHDQKISSACCAIAASCQPERSPRGYVADPRTEKITEWKAPLAWESPYDVVADRTGKVWEVNESSDRLGRLDPQTGTWINYPLPRYSNLRRVFVDDRTPQIAVWAGNDHAASIIRLEPLN